MTTAMVAATRPRNLRERIVQLLTQGPGVVPEAKPFNLSHSYQLRAGQIRVLINPERERKLTDNLRAAQTKHDKAVDQAFEKQSRARAAAKAAYDKAMAVAVEECNSAVAKARTDFEAFEQEQLREFSLPPSLPSGGAVN